MGKIKNKKMKFAVAALIGSASANWFHHESIMTPEEYQFMSHIVEYGKTYGTREEYNFRLALFRQNLKEVEAHNANPKETHTLTTNFMSTWTQEEKKQLNGYIPDNRVKTPTVLDDTNLTAATVDWRTKGAVTPVKNQGQCGSCWSFSTTGALEGAHFVASGQLTSLSEQQFVDCDTKQDQGCNGGLMDNAFKYAETTPVMTESEYPYLARRSIFKKCSKASSEGVVTVKTFHDVGQSASQMKAALDKQPVSVAIEADKSVFQGYHSGVITSSSCGTQLDHGVLAVGYGTLGGEDYFLVKNSWGSSWGDEGYVRIGQNNICGILQAASYPETN